MERRNYIRELFLIPLLLSAVVSDYLFYRVPNEIIVLGWSCSFYFGYQSGRLNFWVWGVVAPIILLWPVFHIHALGAGDIKLFSVLGSFYGAQIALHLTIVSFFVAAILSMVHIARNGTLKRYLIYFYHLISSTLITRKVPVVWKRGAAGRRTMIHFTYAILAAYLYFYVSGYFN